MNRVARQSEETSLCRVGDWDERDMSKEPTYNGKKRKRKKRRGGKKNAVQSRVLNKGVDARGLDKES